MAYQTTRAQLSLHNAFLLVKKSNCWLVALCSFCRVSKSQECEISLNRLIFNGRGKAVQVVYLNTWLVAILGIMASDGNWRRYTYVIFHKKLRNKILSCMVGTNQLRFCETVTFLNMQCFFNKCYSQWSSMYARVVLLLVSEICFLC